MFLKKTLLQNCKAKAKVMKNITILLIALMILSFGFLSGCTNPPQNNNQIKVGFEVINCHRFIKNLTIDGEYNGKPSRWNDSGMYEVKLTIKNTGNKITTYVVDFQFISEESEAEIHIWNSNECGCNAVEPAKLNSQYDQKQVIVNPGEFRLISSSCNPNPNGIMVVHDWCYEITSYE
jgi:hypothetical protein